MDCRGLFFRFYSDLDIPGHVTPGAARRLLGRFTPSAAQRLRPRFAQGKVEQPTSGRFLDYAGATRGPTATLLAARLAALGMRWEQKRGLEVMLLAA